MQPALFGKFHILAVTLSVAASIPAAFALRKAKRIVRERVLFVTGILLALMEVGKQYYFFSVINSGVCDPWIFPFQLCSVPMYLCALLPFMGEQKKETVFTFLWDYVLFGAVLALLYPEGLMRPSMLMTLHGFLWHAVLLFIAFLVFFGRDASFEWRVFRRATVLFLALCLTAVCLNLFLEGRGLETSYPDMFYLTPFHNTTQPVASSIERHFGRLCARVLYVAALVLLGMADHALYRNSHRREIHDK